MDLFLFVKTAHILSASILLGTGIGIAFFMLNAHLSKEIQTRAFCAKITVLADYCFTLPAIIIQPLSGLWLVNAAGYDLSETWLLVTYMLYAIIIISWLPVVYIQIRIRNILNEVLVKNTPLDSSYDTLMKAWFLLGWPAIISIIVVFLLMVARPQ